MSDDQLAQLLEAIRQQTAAINRMAESNMALVAAMAESEGMIDEDAQPGSYLDGTPCR
jgi:DNA-directed RNA polymerase sigma subunit (sigma70/sigma32)